MKFQFGLPTVLIGVAAFISFIQPKFSLATPEDVSKTAQEITVIISGPMLGSGVIIYHQRNVYTILTNWHVLEKPGTYTVQTSDKRQYQFNSNQVRHLPNLDLAVFQVTSNQSYRVAELGNSDEARPGRDVTVAGAPKRLEGLEQRIVLPVPGKIILVQSSPDEGGYALIYNNITQPGMSGGPVLDENGRLIGIHGVGTRDERDQKAGFNKGIPVNIFREPLSREMGINLSPIARSSTPPPTRPPATVTPPIQYSTLQNYLAAGRWREADEETSALMLRLGGQESQNWLNEASIDRLQCQDLRAIDQLWGQYSNGRFGFTVQRRIWLNIGGKPGEAKQGVFERFSDSLRWRVRGSWVDYNNLQFSLNAPSGHLPRRFLDGPIWGVFFSRMEVCKM